MSSLMATLGSLARSPRQKQGGAGLSRGAAGETDGWRQTWSIGSQSLRQPSGSWYEHVGPPVTVLRETQATEKPWLWRFTRSTLHWCSCDSLSTVGSHLDATHPDALECS